MTDQARAKALDYLARREHSRTELRVKLARFVPENEINALLDQLEQENLQSDARYVECYVRSRTQSGFGPVRIHAELMKKGLDQDLIRQHLSSEMSDWLSHLSAVWHKKFHPDRPLSKKDYERQARFLLQRGFSQEMVFSLLDELRTE